MQHSIFVNREAELGFLQQCFKEKKPQLVIIYGRRRVGKTYLIERFLKNKLHAHYLCSKGNELEQINLLSKTLGRAFDDPALQLNPFTTWDSFFKYLYEKIKNKRVILTIDEFPFLVQVNPAISSIFQKYWDQYLSKTKLFLILCGSSIGMMESETMAYKAPLYGRRTGQWKVVPLKFKHLLPFFKEKDIERAINFYAITNGIAFYLNQLDLTKDPIKAIMHGIAKKGKILYEEGEFLIREELKEPATYFSILYAVAVGKTKQSEIANAIGMPSTALPRYLTTLIRLNFLEKLVPVTEGKRTKKGLYVISDNFLDFWFKFIYPNKQYIEEDNEKEVRKALDDFNQFVSRKFEHVCKEALTELTNQVFKPTKIGKWWHKDKEIDIVALNEKTKQILFAECKWQNKVNVLKIVKELIDKAKHVQWHNNKRKEAYAVFAKSFSKKIKKLQGKPVRCFDLKDLKRALKKRK